MAGRRAEGHAPWVPLHAALDPAAPQVARRRRPSRATALSALAAALLLFVFSSGGTSRHDPQPEVRCHEPAHRPGTTYAKKTSVNTGALLTLSATVTAAATRARAPACAVRIELVPVQRDQRQERLVAVRRDLRVRRQQAVQDGRHADAEPDQGSDPGADGPAHPAAPTAEPTAAPTADPNASPVPTESPLPTTAPTPTAAPTATPNPVALPATITFYGRGYGHGVGLSQYGAKGRALDGQTAETILAHYYKGTTLGSMPNSQVRVLVLQSFAATASNPVQVYGRGSSWTIDGISKTFPVDARLQFTPTVSGTTTTWKVLVTATDGSTLYSAASSSSIRIRTVTGATLQLWSTPSPTTASGTCSG